MPLNFKRVLTVIVLSSLALNASELRDETIKALIDRSKKTDKKLETLQEEFTASKETIKNLQRQLDELKAMKHQQTLLNPYKSPITESERDFIMITAWAVKVRSKADANSRVLGYLKMGDCLKVDGEDNGWYKTEKGFVFSKNASKVDPREKIKVIPNRKEINIRKSPFFGQNSILKTASKNDTLSVYPVLFLNKWFMLSDHSGFVYKDAVTKVR